MLIASFIIEVQMLMWWVLEFGVVEVGNEYYQSRIEISCFILLSVRLAV
jgi:hypothetical protein